MLNMDRSEVWRLRLDEGYGVCKNKTKWKPNAVGSIWRGGATEWTRPGTCAGARDMEFALTR